MRLTRNEHHRKVRAPLGDISDSLVNTDVSGFCHEYTSVLGLEDGFTLVPPTTPCRLPPLPAASFNVCTFEERSSDKIKKGS
jgi:hypothetical protein